MEEKVKISDIARQSGVSTATVSLALNNKAGVSQETRLRVLKVAEELEYPIKPVAVAGKSSRLATLGMIVKTDPNPLPPQANPFYSKVIVGIEDVCRRNGINLLFATLPVDENNNPVEIPQLLYNERIDGLLMVGAFVDETIISISGKHTPHIVLVDGYSNTESYDAIITDNFRAAYQAVSHLIKNGHRHIGLIGSETDGYPSLQERRNGYFRALKENEITQSYVANFNINTTHGYDDTVRLLQENPQITGLFCVNDEIGFSAIRAAQDQGLRVPEDISIIGFDDTYIAAKSRPSLTTMRVDTISMGRAAVHLLSIRLDNPEAARMTLVIHPTLMKRESVSTVRSTDPVIEKQATRKP